MRERAKRLSPPIIIMLVNLLQIQNTNTTLLVFWLYWPHQDSHGKLCHYSNQLLLHSGVMYECPHICLYCPCNILSKREGQQLWWLVWKFAGGLPGLIENVISWEVMWEHDEVTGGRCEAVAETGKSAL